MTIEWADGSGLSMKSPPGRTAFFSTSQLYELLSPDEKTLVDHSWVEYAPYPYKWIERCKGNSNGLGLAEGGQRLTMEELGEYDPAAIKKASASKKVLNIYILLHLVHNGRKPKCKFRSQTNRFSIFQYPMVWVNPLTGEKAFQVHGICARKLYLRRSQDESPHVVDDIAEIRRFILDIQNRILRPEYVLLAPIEEGDVIVWNNYGLFHSAIDYPLKLGPRSMHQANIGGSVGPRGPVPIPIGVSC